MIIASYLGLSENGSEKVKGKRKKTRSVVTFCGWGWCEKQKDILQKQSPGRVLQEWSSKIFGKAYRKTHEQEL